MDRIDIPEHIKREVRQAAGFGCVLCGSPVYQYDHVDGYGVTGHVASEMTLLCPEHHNEKTLGRMPVSLVRAAALNPRNLRHELSRERELYFDGTDLSVGLGNFTLESAFVRGIRGFGLYVDGQTVLGAQIIDGRLVIDADLRNIDNEVMLRIQGGQMRLSNRFWDVTFVGRTLTVRSGPRAIALRMTLQPPNRIEIESANFFHNHVHFLVGTQAQSGGLELPDSNDAWSHLTFEGGAVAIGQPSLEKGMFVSKVPRAYGAPPAQPNGAFARP